MPIYYVSPLVDLGYHVDALDGPGEIWGLDNQATDEDDQRFHHLGYDGYPDGAQALYDRPDHGAVLAVLPDGTGLPVGGTEIAATDVVDLLVAEYSWPQGTSLGADGLPVRPREV